MVQEECKPSLKFNMMEFSGSLGDLGIFIPLVVGMVLVSGLDMGVVLILAGLMNIITGFMFMQPIPVQPMKALAAVAIAEGLARGELFAAGIIMGVALIITSKYINQITKYVPKVLVRGIQLGIGIKLAVKGVNLVKDLPFFGWDSIFLAIVVTIALLFFIEKRKPGLLIIFGVGLMFAVWMHIRFGYAFYFQWPQFEFYLPSMQEYKVGFLKGVLAQFPLTILNSVIAVCALSADYFPKNGVSYRKMAFSVGLMNVISVPLGGIPMCHGSGGLAAQYRFGARSGGSVIMLGAAKVFVGLFLGSTILVLLSNYPMSVLGIMLIFAGIELSKMTKDMVENKLNFSMMLIIAVFIIGANTFIGFMVGLFLIGLTKLKKIYV